MSFTPQEEIKGEKDSFTSKLKGKINLKHAAIEVTLTPVTDFQFKSKEIKAYF